MQVHSYQPTQVLLRDADIKQAQIELLEYAKLAEKVTKSFIEGIANAQ
jgi:hypothetical protein